MGRIKVEKTDNETKKHGEVKKSIDKNRRASLSTINIVETLQPETFTTSNTFDRFVQQIKSYKGTELVPSCDINEICLNIFAAMREIFVGEELKLKLMQFCDYLTDPKTLILYIDLLEGNVDVNLVLSIMYLSPVDAEPMLSSTPLEYVFDADIQLTNQNRVQTKWRHLVEVDKELKKQNVVAWSESAMIECLDKMRSLTEVPCFVQDATSLVSTPASSNSDSRCDDIRDDFWTHLKRQKAYSVFEIIPYVFDEIESKPPKTIQQWSLFSESMRKQVYKLSVPYELDNLVSHIVLMYMRPKPNESPALNEKNVLYDEYKISISRNKENFLVFFFLKTNIV